MDGDIAVYAPIEISELLHSTLGPLCDVLERDGHHWAPVVKRVLFEYVKQRDDFISDVYGRATLSYVHHITYEAAERVCRITDLAISEEIDFAQWAKEVGGETA